jgi:hypothetical protein
VTRLAIVLACLAGVLAAGCGSDETTAAPARLTEAIKYEVIGGDAFRDDKLTVQPDGRASVQTRSGERTAKLTADELAALARGVDALTEAETAVTDPPQPDAMSYRFTYRGRQVQTDSGALPEQLEPLIGTFNALIDRYGS